MELILGIKTYQTLVLSSFKTLPVFPNDGVLVN